MLRITTDDKPKCLTLRLEGRLHGPWVPVLDECWSKALPAAGGRQVRVDLNGVTFVDAEGKAQLAEMYAQGAELLGEDLQTKAIVAEIRAGQTDDGDSEVTRMSSHAPAAILHEQLTDLQRLQAELHEVNEELAKAARPLNRISDLNEEQRQNVAKQLRAGLARWDSLTQRIAQVLGIESGNRQGTPERNEGESR
jgi:anti-anti-sigma regulatory factor